MAGKNRIAVFASGEGTNFEAIVSACKSGALDAEVALMVCDHPHANVVERARRHGVETLAFDPKSYSSKSEYETFIADRMDALDIRLVCLAGYMRIVGDVLLSRYEGRIINIHPSLLPAFKGARAVEQAVAYGVKVYGITVHYVNADLDSGRIILQKAFEYDGDDPAEVHRLGQLIEHPLYVQAIRKCLDSVEPAPSRDSSES